LAKHITVAVSTVETVKRINPVQWVRPKIPAAAPEKQAEKNFVFAMEEFDRTFGG
jgi:hypothetical protein